MRYPALLITISLVFSTLTPVAQKPGSATRPADTDFLPAGPFLFEPGAIHPTYMDAFDSRPVVKSPDGTAQITVTGPPESLKAWITIQFLGRDLQRLEYRVWPIEANVDVLWRPDSEAFALTDNRYADDSYVLVFGTHFYMGERGTKMGVPISDLTPVVWHEFEGRAQKFYAPDAYDTDLIYAKALRWMGNDQLLVGLDARTSLTNPPGPKIQDMRIREWHSGYLVDVPSKKVVDEFSEGQLLSHYGIKVAK